ncbi:Ribonuclease E [Hartmannibacter diazotrophicus]|uniref:Ribonuclease E n=1 Tax=Hartmannibacter diazotrophicus TaxID=1482074 RepID=A0A2C9D9M2_9HYPH|nr:ribonuclease E/G [Hartmannibacter diazotrophicus]SON56441.1 Ribonuclease E [Hartmannibacter diazotrophicus]
MSNKMLIDATHPEETRVVVVKGQRVEEFDFESANRKQLRGNIYLAKVTRVEPSLQAAFVEYGGNRHGFLAFSEIHPDYYQIPVADRQALLDAEAEEAREEAESQNNRRGRRPRGRSRSRDNDAAANGKNTDESTVAASSDEPVVREAADEAEERSFDQGEGVETFEAGAGTVSDDTANDEATGDADDTASGDAASDDEGEAVRARRDDQHDDDDHDEDDASDEEDSVESVGAEDALEELPERRKPRMRQYKIQEVIKRRQVLLVQVVKEERGNKGAALTTYLSLAGRYSVLMPNTGRGGGISRKITNPADRKRLKEVAQELEVPDGMGIILRTAGASRTKAEIKRDFEYLLRLWENVRDYTLKSSAPMLVYEEGSLVKRSIRDLYNKDITQVLVSGDEAYREAKDFMRMLMPSHAKNVQPYRDTAPIFARYSVEPQLDAMFSPQVTLRSGGYLVINQTEALVSIDVNSGRSTREHNIEDTAYQTNMEAAEEVARQLRLRDLAGLIVIDFIDMEEPRNNKAVERKLKDCLKNDRARIQVGRISHFGLMEMSRQRIRTGVLEGSTEVCPHCLGAGIVRSTESVALHVLRSLEDQLLKGVTHHLTIRTRTAVALYILNQKRKHLGELEERFGLTITISADEHMAGQHYVLERGEIITNPIPAPQFIHPDTVYPDDELDEVEEIEEVEESREEQDDGDDESRGRNGKRRRRRRRRGGDQPPAQAQRSQEAETDEGSSDDEDEGDTAEAQAGDDGQGENGRRRSRRRGRRGGRRRGNGTGTDANAADGESDKAADEMTANGDEDAEAVEVSAAPEAEVQSESPAELPNEAEATVEVHAETEVEAESQPDAEEGTEPQETAAAEEPATETVTEEAPEESREAELETVDAGAPASSTSSGAASAPEPEDDDRPKRSGWWQRRSFF